MKGSEERELIEFLADHRRDPLGFVERAFPWGEGALEGYDGPRKWQREFLKGLGEKLQHSRIAGDYVVREAVSSGHGIGKSALVSMVSVWAYSTCEDARGVLTAGTERQLSTKTWPELAKWHRMSIARGLFDFEATCVKAKAKPHWKTWRLDMVPWSEHNYEAFQGLHNKGKRILLVFDEASAIHDKIWEVCEGALTDEKTEIIWLAFGNPTQPTGGFRECFGKRRHRWNVRQIDSRHVEGTNKGHLDAMVADYGEDSDIVRVRVRGMFPKQSSLQLIGSDIVHQAQKIEARSNLGDPLIMALDIARGGDDTCVFRFRRGLDGRSLPPVKIPGSEVRDSMILIAKAVELLNYHKPDAFFYDGTGVGGPVGDRIRQLGFMAIEVGFGNKSPVDKYANMRAFMWYRMLEWLRSGGAIDFDPVLEQDLTSVQYSHNPRDQLLLERKEHMKERGLASPDDGDALAMTFAFPVAPVSGVKMSHRHSQANVISEWDPLAEPA